MTGQRIALLLLFSKRVESGGWTQLKDRLIKGVIVDFSIPYSTLKAIINDTAADLNSKDQWDSTPLYYACKGILHFCRKKSPKLTWK